MLGMGLTLTWDDFRRILIYPKAVALGLVNQLLLLPAVAFMFCILFDLPAELSVGLMILAACPGGATSNLIAHLAKGDTALSVTLTAISSLITVVTIPIIVNFAILYFIPDGREQQLNVLGTVVAVLVITIVPVLIGMILNKKYPTLAQRLDRPFKIISAVFLVAIIVAALLKERANIVEYFSAVGPAALALNLFTLILGYFSARLLGLGKKQSVTISIESGIQNGTLGITIAATLLVNSQMAIPSAIYSLLMFGTATVLIFMGNRIRV
jgi:BASS family bile acid:Na+ symporter